MFKKIKALFLGGLMAVAIAAPTLLAGAPSVHAQALTEDEFFGGEITGSEFADTAGLTSGDLPTTIAAIIRVALGFLGIIAVCIILIGGFKWMTAQGNEDKVKTAKKVLISGIIGLVIVLSAFAIAQFVISSIVTATS
ncbi:hypothetical protein A2348_02280 [Candidatus Uhrbacteria bacterium RIFOXYB12_FULL_58_10]|uniref:DUF4134 domain-containing protein n=1 Tax=Candidatus Uhrbacteria bacterium RIFOXYB2_FULL_57_15 TaxID=1802422 RepID=A0A1F7WBP3_9BACT|nr:MAG: hypothetical protein A2348_02280 [Candidatus Uhrbacteria bacterium RIFOXYB12_FULL_58_10]OGL99627.1 MAG: hypothetical protein A2304_04465 [Candidatus Uhrbacteria bacterium RIFOXYB2_FULL_57_15]OGM00450.1 MAG: hypothetical protein A2501_00605 [Candidatus Uhrbacteria bacterium RIFOXYC12_FULL_57_11]